MSDRQAAAEQLKSEIGAALNAIDRRAPQLTFDEFRAAYNDVLSRHLSAAQDLGIRSYLESVVASRICGMAFLYWDQPYDTVKPLHDELSLIPPYATEGHLIVKWPLWCRYLIHTGHLAEARSVFDEFKSIAENDLGKNWKWAREWIQTLEHMLGDAGAATG